MPDTPILRPRHTIVILVATRKLYLNIAILPDSLPEIPANWFCGISENTSLNVSRAGCHSTTFSGEETMTEEIHFALSTPVDFHLELPLWRFSTKLPPTFGDAMADGFPGRGLAVFRSRHLAEEHRLPRAQPGAICLHRFAAGPHGIHCCSIISEKLHGRRDSVYWAAGTSPTTRKNMA